MSDTIKHIIRQNDDGITLEANHNSDQVTLDCNSTKKTLMLQTKNVSVELASDAKTLILKTPKYKLSLDESSNAIEMTDGARTFCLNDNELSLKNGPSLISVTSSEIHLNAPKITLKGDIVELG